jgi:hypothetical protein
MVRLVTALAVAMALVCPASAESRRFGFTEPLALEAEPTVVIGTPTAGVVVDRIHVAVETHDDSTRARLTISLSTRSTNGINTELSLAVPAGSRVTNLALTLGHAPRASAIAMPAFDGFVRYLRATETSVDPALLSFERSTGLHDRLLLQVSPVAKGAPAIVELDVDAPTSRRVAFETKQFVRHLVVEQVREGVLDAIRTEVKEHAAVDEHTSLFVGPPPREPLVIACSFGGVTESPVTLSGTEIRREIRRHIAQLGYCYSRELQRHQTLAGTVALKLRLMPDGTTQVRAVDGELDSDAVKSCVAGEAAQWTFHEHTDVIDVNYPLTFVKPPWM